MNRVLQIIVAVVVVAALIMVAILIAMVSDPAQRKTMKIEVDQVAVIIAASDIEYDPKAIEMDENSDRYLEYIDEATK